MIKITKTNEYKEHPYALPINNEFTLHLSSKELEQLFKKVGKILGKGKDYCVYCKADLK